MNLEVPLVVVSDVHLKGIETQRGQKFKFFKVFKSCSGGVLSIKWRYI